MCCLVTFFFFFQAEDGIRDSSVTGVQTCALPILALESGLPSFPPDTCNLVGNWGDHSPRLNTLWRPIVNQYREGKAKRTPARGVKKNLKLYAYKQSEGHAGTSVPESLTACLLLNEPASYSYVQG